MVVLYILVKFIVLSFYYYFVYSQAYHSRYMTGDCEFYVYMCIQLSNIEKNNNNNGTKSY